MDKKINVTVFQCEYCNKISYSAGGMRIHEICCKKNPANLSPCASCANCVKNSILISDEEIDNEEFTVREGDEIDKEFIEEQNRQTEAYMREGYFKYHRETTFTCLCDGSKLYHNKVNRLSKSKAKLIISKCDKQMPTECENYKELWGIINATKFAACARRLR